MPDYYTSIADIIEPSIFTNYVIERTATLSALWTSGIVGTDSQLSALAKGGGSIIDMPFWTDLTGMSQILDDTTDITVAKIATARDKARLIGRAQAWGATDLASTFAGSDPMSAIGDLVAAWWARDMQTTLLNVLAGVFGAASMAGNVHDISSESGTAAVLSAEAFIDALGKMGDARGGLSAVMMHSSSVALLEKLDMIDTMPDSTGKPVSTYRGKRIIEDDNCPNADGVYTSYIFGAGAIGYGEGTPKVPTATVRQELTNGGEEYLVNRRHFILHPRGVAWQEASCVADTPTNAELATAANWVRAYEAKNIRIVKFVYRLAEAAGS